jgi:hypothetical protein
LEGARVDSQEFFYEPGLALRRSFH